MSLARRCEVSAKPGWATRKRAVEARGAWLLFLHGDTVLEEGWDAVARAMIIQKKYAAGVFQLSFDANGIAPRLVAAGAMLRTKFLKIPYGDQGLLISRKAYDEIGGYNDMPLFEDVDFIDRLIKRYKGKAFVVLDAKAVTSSARYEREGYVRRVFRNAILSTRYRLGASPEKLAREYRS